MKLRSIIALTPLLVAMGLPVEPVEAAPLNPALLTKYVDALPRPPRMLAKGANTSFVITESEFDQKLHRDLPPTTVWGYNNSYPGPTIEATRGVPINVTFENELFAPTLLARLPVDRTIAWADPLGLGPGFDPYFGPVPTTVHLHGAEVPSASDGHPDSWFTPFLEFVGPKFIENTNHYVNTQQATTLWYHDHSFGITRLTVWGGLAAFYLLRDPPNEPQNLPSGDFEREIVVQDRLFDTDGQLRYVDDVPNPTVHPFWSPMAFGDTILVNGKIWPNLDVEPRKYRFRLLNGSNSRFYNMSLDSGRTFQIIGTDGGYLNAPVTVSQFTVGPAERMDFVVDFSGLAAGTTMRLRNDAPSPFPFGSLQVDPNTTGQIMQFRVVSPTGPDTSIVPGNLRPHDPIVPLTKAPIALTRTLTLNEVDGPGGPLGFFLDGKQFDDPVTEKPLEGTTEIWEVANLTGLTHPIHLHLIQFQILNRQQLDAPRFAPVFNAVNPIIPVPPGTPFFAVPFNLFLGGPALPPAPFERGWKDTVRMNPGDVTRLLVRAAPLDTPASDTHGVFPFDPSIGPGYVWHCHILEHEDNEMMRPLRFRTR